jgi:hypothetical protein
MQLVLDAESWLCLFGIMLLLSRLSFSSVLYSYLFASACLRRYRQYSRTGKSLCSQLLEFSAMTIIFFNLIFISLASQDYTIHDVFQRSYQYFSSIVPAPVVIAVYVVIVYISYLWAAH